LEALTVIALSLPVLMAGAGSARWPGAAPNARQWLVAALAAIRSVRLGLHFAVRTAGITEDPRYAAFACEWGVDSPR
jgi:steroid 5-alpha reductase family enzyme